MLDVTKGSNSLEPAERVVHMEQDYHETVEGVQLGLKLLQHLFICEVPFFDNCEHELRMFITEPLTSDCHHKLEETPHCLTRVPFIKMSHCPQYLHKLGIFTKSTVVHLKLFEEILCNFA